MVSAPGDAIHKNHVMTCNCQDREFAPFSIRMSDRYVSIGKRFATKTMGRIGFYFFPAYFPRLWALCEKRRLLPEGFCECSIVKLIGKLIRVQSFAAILIAWADALNLPRNEKQLCAWAAIQDKNSENQAEKINFFI
jgi:hypothetical protein